MKAAIFDVDGTLIDSVDLHAKAWQEALNHFGRRLDFGAIRSQIGKGGDQLLPALLPKEEVEARGKEMEEYRGKLFKQRYLSQVKPFPQVRSLFERFLQEGWRLALASSAKADELKTYKEMTHISDLVETETSSDDAEKSKPHPDIFLAALDRLGDMSAEDCVVVGDSPFDAEAAAKAGMPSVGFLSGGFPEQLLRESGCRAIYRDAADMLHNFDQFTQTMQRP